MPSPPPELPDELLGEAFLRLPTDDPACLLRASLACKRWRRVLSDPVFRRRHRELHPTPSVVGFLRNSGDFASRFVPNNTASVRPAARDLPGRFALDCHHGRVLFCVPSPLHGTSLNYDLVVWNPLTNEHRCLPRLSPPLTKVSGRHFNAAVLCSATVEGCDHTMCHGGPFRVAFIWTHTTGGWLSKVFLSARVYSSETDNWSEAISIRQPRQLCSVPMRRRKTLVGDTLYFHCTLEYALEYQLGAQRLSIIEGPPRRVSQEFLVMPMGNGGLGCMVIKKVESRLCLQLWSTEAASGSDEVERWARGKAIDLEELLPNGALSSPWFQSASLLGFVEGTDVIFVGTRTYNHPGGIYMVQLNSGTATKLSAFDTAPIPFYNEIIIPYTSFCFPVIDASSTTKGPGDDASVIDASSATEGAGDDASGA